MDALLYSLVPVMAIDCALPFRTLPPCPGLPRALSEPVRCTVISLKQPVILRV